VIADQQGLTTMRTNILVLAAFFMALPLCAATTPSATSDSVHLSLKADPDTALPGVPVNLRIVINNRTNHVVVMPPTVLLRVTPQGGEPFDAIYGVESSFGRVGSWPKGVRHPLRVLPGETLEVADEVDTTLLTPVWFWDKRLNRPGKYQLQLLAEPNPPAEGNRIDDDLLLNDPDFLKGRVISEPASLTVLEPEGEDAKVWQEMQKVSKGAWTAEMFSTHGFALANFVWKNHPTSHYLHDVGTLLAISDPNETFRAVEAAINVDPNGPRRDLLRSVFAAYCSRRAEEIALVQGNIEAATALATTAANTFKDLARNAKSGTVRAEAERGLTRVPDREALMEQKRHGERARQKRQ
jgi:hypothetical protein